MRAEADRNAIADDFCDAAEGVAVRLRGVDSGNHLFLGCAIQSAQRRRVGGCVEVRRHLVGAARVDPSQVHNMAPQGDAEFAEKAPADGSRGHASGRLAGGCALQHVSSVIPIVLEHPREIDMPWARTRHSALAVGISIPGRRIHYILPILPVAMLIQNRDWKNWQDIMDPALRAEDSLEGRKRQVTRVRPGHADLTGLLKYD